MDLKQTTDLPGKGLHIYAMMAIQTLKISQIFEIEVAIEKCYKNVVLVFRLI